MEKILKSIPVEKIRRNPQQPRVNFDAEAIMEQIGELKIHWTGAADKARSTCRRCILYDDANPSTCRDCPLIEFLKSLAD